MKRLLFPGLAILVGLALGALLLFHSRPFVVIRDGESIGAAFHPTGRGEFFTTADVAAKLGATSKVDEATGYLTIQHDQHTVHAQSCAKWYISDGKVQPIRRPPASCLGYLPIDTLARALGYEITRLDESLLLDTPRPPERQFAHGSAVITP